MLAYADQAIAIPMLGMTNSLNVATAGAIVLHALVQRLRDLRTKVIGPSPGACRGPCSDARTVLPYTRRDEQPRPLTHAGRQRCRATDPHLAVAFSRPP